MIGIRATQHNRKSVTPRSPGRIEALEVQIRFAREAISDYVAESRKLTALLNPVAARSLGALTGAINP